MITRGWRSTFFAHHYRVNSWGRSVDPGLVPKSAGSQPRFQPQDLLKQVMIQHLALAPDASSIVYSRRTIENNRYRSRLWRVGYEGGRAEQLTSAGASDS